MTPDMPAQATTLLPDTALSDPSLDRLDRASFARSLAQSILGLGGQDSFVVGLCGPWGSGKTSVLNFVVSDLEAQGANEQIVLRFNPWWFSGRDQLLESFLSQFAAVMQVPKRGEKAHKAASLLSTLSAGLRPLSLLPVIGEAAKLAREATDAVAGASKAYAEAVERDVIEVRKQIDELLKDFPHRIVVVMDDIDRLSADEIAQLFLILKAVADFPRTVYLLAFDHQIVARAIQNKLGVDGKTYLEKIVQLQIDVPPTSQSSVHQMFLDQLNELLVGETPDQRTLQEFGNIFHDGIKHFLATPRAVKKLINMLRFALPPLRGEVNAVDMVAISCLSTFVPQVIPIIATNQERFVGTGTGNGLSASDHRKEAEVFHKQWLSQVAEGDREAVEGIVQRLFPAVSYALGGSGYATGIETNWQARLRACSSSHFEKYFRLAVPQGAISEADWSRLLSKLDDSSSMDEAILELAAKKGPGGFLSQVSEFLERALLFAKTTNDADAIEKLFLALVRNGDQLCAVEDAHALGGMFSIDNRRRIEWVLLELLEHIDATKSRQELVKKAVRQPTSLFIATELIISLGYQNGRYGDKDESNRDPRHQPIVKKSFVSDMAREVSRAVETAGQNVNLLAQHPNFMKVLVNWWRLGAKKAAKKWLVDTVSEDRLLVEALKQQVNISRSHGSNDRVAMQTPVIDTGFLSNFLKLKEVRTRCESLLTAKPDWLDENGIKTLQLVVGSITPNGKPIDQRERRRAELIGKSKKRAKKKAAK